MVVAAGGAGLGAVLVAGCSTAGVVVVGRSNVVVGEMVGVGVELASALSAAGAVDVAAGAPAGAGRSATYAAAPRPTSTMTPTAAIIDLCIRPVQVTGQRGPENSREERTCCSTLSYSGSVFPETINHLSLVI